ncbi:MAG: PilN domain-containing protein [Phycisphaerae bacterium]|nr:PilN domain-containing protein [Phycisphaerae bacterium]
MSIINLLPDDYIKRRQQQRINSLCLTLFLIVMAALAAAVGVSEQSARRTRQVVERIDAEYADAAKLLGQLQDLETHRQKVLHKAQRTAALLERVPRSTLLAIITNALPRHASLTRFQLMPKQVVARAESASGESKFQNLQARRGGTQVTEVLTVEVDGLAGTDVDVALFIAELIRNPLLSGVDLVFSQEKVLDDVPVREFQVKMEIKPNVDVMDVLQAAHDRPASSAQVLAEARKTGDAP